ncbi:hypothetical protein LguiB_031798 [Lonicera macranthoides]
MDGREMSNAAKKLDTLIFAVNGERFELSDVDPSTTLLEFLRTHTRFKGVKLSCGEGGCGACDVLLSKYDPVLKQVENDKVNSCLALLCSINGCSITTTEGLGNSKDGLHPIHKRMAGFHASQCGFCTPAMCISLFSALVNAKNANRPEPPPGFSKLTVLEAEQAIVGNLCRCTGYRPIADTCKSFAADVDIEDLGINAFWKKGDSIEDKISKLPFYDPNDEICTYPEFLKYESKPLNFKSQSWSTPLTIEELQSLLQVHLAGNGTKIRLVVGNTSTGYYHDLEHYDKYIDLRYIPELSLIRRDHTGIEIGATVPISKAILALREEHEGELCSEAELVFQKIANHMERVASESIRNFASVGGNLVIAQRRYFRSDIATIFLAVDSIVSIITGQKHEKLTFEEFLGRPPLDSKSVLLSVKIPCWKPERKGLSSETETKLLFESYRASPRPLGNALPFLNAAFLADISSSKTGLLVKNIHLAFGAYGTKHAIRARKVEEYLVGKVLSFGVLYEAVKLVKAAVVPEHGTSYPAYRSSLAVGFLFEFLLPLIDPDSVTSDPYEFDDVGNPGLVSSAKQVIEPSKEYYPVGKPIMKTEAALQASGEAIYVDDIPSPENCLHGAFIHSTKALAWVKDVKFESKSLPDGVTDIISFKDIPKGGENIGSNTQYGDEPLFADDITSYAGQPVAFVVADTQKHADVGAAMAIIDYDTEGLGPPILTVEEAFERSCFFEVPSDMYPAQVGDFSKGMSEADHKILSAEIRLGSQYFFYMETQTALAIPDEDNCMVVYSSSQCPENVHTVIARCLGIPEHNVRVITRRVGGGFGGKATKSMHVAVVYRGTPTTKPASQIAAASALAAHKLRRPVRIYVNRKSDMLIAGGRQPMKITYSVGFKSNGKITALHLDILINSGIVIDLSPIVPGYMIGSLKKYDWGALSFNIKLCKTNTSAKTSMRGPGEVYATFIAEAIIERVASTLSMEVDFIRTINLHTYESLSFFYEGSAGEPQEYTLPSIMDKLASTSSFEKRIEMTKEYNLCDKWRKKGISRVPIIHQCSLQPIPAKVSILWDGSVAVEVGGIEIGQGLWTKVKQMTAYAFSLIQCDGTEDLLDKVRVIQADTLSLVQGGITAGSSTSESSCGAVRVCCDILVGRLAPLKEKLRKQMGSVTWGDIILQAHSENVNLSASTYLVPDSNSLHYLNYGAAVSEVEVNIITGETRILRSDIIYDCGQSLNPAVDLGQIEGAFVQGIGFFMSEEYLSNSDGMVVTVGTWTYEIPTIDTIPTRFNVEVLNSGHHKQRVLSSKASGEPPLLLAVSVHCATRAAIKEARKQLRSWGGLEGSDSESTLFDLEVPATMPVVKQLCGLDSVEKYLHFCASLSDST